VRVEGAADLGELLFPHGLIPQILSLFIDVWRVLRRPDLTESEPKITNRFVKALAKEKRRRGYRFTVKPHEKELEHLDESTGRGYGEIDIVVQHGCDERCYFAFEAKKLCTGPTEEEVGSRDYVGEPGMGCFIDGRYASYQQHAGMLGYVMDGNCSRAKSAITVSIEKKANDLRLAEPRSVEPCPDMPECSDVFETWHNLDRGKFRLIHILLGV
jgi:hypothetical protein